MKVTYMNHSSFFFEYSDKAILIDYGELPVRAKRGEISEGVFELARQKSKYSKLIGYSSHRHEDHYDPGMVQQFLADELLYILSDEHELEFEEYMDNTNFFRIFPQTTINIDILHFANAGSTDQGGAVLLQDHNENFSIYFGGDLAVWDDLPEFYDGFDKEFVWLKEQVANFSPVKIAFLPCGTSDGYQEEPLLNGSKDLIELMKPQIVIPMHGFGYEHFYKSFAEEMQQRLTDNQVEITTFTSFTKQKFSNNSIILSYAENPGDSIVFN
ncbi:MAG TPA: MBL fold metallo-hydrolase [Clostridiaceae bacterium]|nr:MBL fold metallo-hydrolase [Clostridiaceae bacterium]